jgi:hypothetical protein
MRLGFIFACILVTVIWWYIAGSLIFGIAAGECFPSGAHVCPTDHQRQMTLLSVFTGALLGYFAVLLFMARSGRRKNKNSN